MGGIWGSLVPYKARRPPLETHLKILLTLAQTSYILYTRAGPRLNIYLTGGEEEERFVGTKQASSGRDEKGNRLQPT